MELPTNNLYSTGKVLSFEDGTQMLVRDKLTILPQGTDSYHTVKANDRLEQIAWYHYRRKVSNSMFYWFVIADANNIENPLDISDWVGKEILIPDIIRIKLEFDI